MAGNSVLPSGKLTDDFREIRFKTFRPFSVRLGFLVAAFPLLTLVPDCLELPGLAFPLLLRRGTAALLLLVYPLALAWQAPRRALPWILYGSTILLFFFMA